MKRKILQTTIVALLFIVATISCKKDEPLNSIALDKTLTVFVGETATLTVTFIPNSATNKKISWESSDPTIATVENGKVSGIAFGEAKITATSQDGGRTAYCMVTVIQPIEPEIVWVEGGTFTMGCTDEQGDECVDNEKPSHSVTLSGFYMGKYEVTQKEWVVAMGKNPSFHRGDNLPVECTSWNDIQQYIQRLNAYTGKNYRLPTEAEWEYAARGGKLQKEYMYSGSDILDDVAWYSGNSDDITQPVGTKKPNDLNIYDMSGNVFEWCSDWYGAYQAIPQTNPTGPEVGIGRIARGGGVGVDTYYQRVLVRTYAKPENTLMNLGFRLVLTKD